MDDRRIKSNSLCDSDPVFLPVTEFLSKYFAAQIENGYILLTKLTARHKSAGQNPSQYEIGKLTYVVFGELQQAAGLKIMTLEYFEVILEQTMILT